MHSIEEMILYARSFLGVPYKYGGRNRLEGLDCSQLVIDILSSQGMWPHKVDANAQGIFDYFATKANDAIPSDQTIAAQKGALAFFGKDSDNIVHIGYCINDNLMIEAGGGDSTTVDLKSAIERSAYVKIRPILYRRDYFCCLMPKYK